MNFEWEKIIQKAHHTLRTNCLRLGKNYAYIPKYIFKEVPFRVEVYIDKKNKAIMLVPSEQGYKLTEHNAYIFNCKALARKMPLGNYKLAEGDKYIFVFEGTLEQLDKLGKEER